MTVRIKENSFFARLAAKTLKSREMAVVWGTTIHLWNVSREDFLRSPSWVLHELAHVRQVQRYGLAIFVLLYLWESARSGYTHNRFEVEARLAEAEHPDFSDIEFSS